MARINDEPALVLHSRPYRESSQLLDLLTLNHGRVAAVLKGQRRGSHRSSAALGVFSSFSVGWYDRGGLVTLVQPELVQARWLTGRAAAGGFYVVELLVRLLREREPVPELFAMACYTLDRCVAGEPLRTALRPFEWQLLEVLGLQPELCFETDGATPVQADVQYLLLGDGALVRQLEVGGQMLGTKVLGATLAAVAAGDFASPAANRFAQQLFRQLVAPLLGARPLRSPVLFKGFKAKQQDGA